MDVAQVANHSVARVRPAVFGMRDSVEYRHFVEIKRADALKACDVDTVLIGVRAPSVMSVDPAFGAKIVLRYASIELI